MTLAEVIDTLQTWIEKADDEYDREEMGRVAGLKEALHEIKKIELCEDAISREDALMALTGEYTDSPIEILSKAIQRIKTLPPVTPAEKVGHWEWNQYDSNPKIGNFHCLQCLGIGKSYYDYCPYCGAKMQEVKDANSD